MAEKSLIQILKTSNSENALATSLTYSEPGEAEEVEYDDVAKDKLDMDLDEVENGADVTGDNTPKDHADRHLNGGDDEIEFDELADGTNYKKMTSDERTKLSAATEEPTASTLVKRDAGGQSKFQTVSVKNTDSNGELRIVSEYAYTEIAIATDTVVINFTKLIPGTLILGCQIRPDSVRTDGADEYDAEYNDGGTVQSICEQVDVGDQVKKHFDVNGAKGEPTADTNIVITTSGAYDFTGGAFHATVYFYDFVVMS